MRRFLHLLVLIALLVAPAGRMTMAAPSPSADAHAGMAGHCAPAAPAPDRDDSRSIDCVIACAAAPAAEIACPTALAPVTVAPVAAIIVPI
ncbi:MAG: hypothetical protein AB7O91_07850, partial [Sphingomonas sp.]